jgi:hypothetical protein
MRIETPGISERLQLDTEGQVIGKLIKMDDQMRLLLGEGFMLVKHQNTGRLLVWDRKKRQTVELAK